MEATPNTSRNSSYNHLLHGHRSMSSLVVTHEGDVRFVPAHPPADGADVPPLHAHPPHGPLPGSGLHYPPHHAISFPDALCALPPSGSTPHLSGLKRGAFSCSDDRLPLKPQDVVVQCAVAAAPGGKDVAAHSSIMHSSLHGGDQLSEVPVKAYLDPPAIYDHIAAAGVSKVSHSLTKEVTLGMLAGGYIGLGFTLCVLCAGQLSQKLRDEQPGLFNFFFGAFGFPFGLSLCVLNGAELFTSNVAYMMAAWLERRCRLRSLAWVWVVSWLANLAGSLLLTQLMLWGNVFGGPYNYPDFVLHLAHKKVSHSWGAALTRGILCNWLVCLAVWQANAANDIAGKLLGIWLPISAFVAMGFEHCIANQYIIPMAMRLGSDITVPQFLCANLVPVTLGNTIGGALFVVTSYGVAYGAPGRAIDAFWSATAARLRALLGGAGLWRGGSNNGTASSKSNSSCSSVGKAVNGARSNRSSSYSNQRKVVKP